VLPDGAIFKVEATEHACETNLTIRIDRRGIATCEPVERDTLQDGIEWEVGVDPGEEFFADPGGEGRISALVCSTQLRR